MAHQSHAAEVLQPHPIPEACSPPEAVRVRVQNIALVWGCKSLPSIMAWPKRTKSEGVDRKPPLPHLLL